MKIRRANVLNLIVMLAVITLQISPACAFNNGSTSSWIEICTANGTIEYVATTDKTTQSDDQTHTAKQQCSFCFTHATQALADLDKAVHTYTAAITSEYIAAGSGSLIYKAYSALNYQTRAPPSFLTI